MYSTRTKAERTPAGLEWVRKANAAATVPWFAIGGIDASTIAEVRAAGASRVAVVSAIMAADDPAEASRQLLHQLA